MIPGWELTSQTSVSSSVKWHSGQPPRVRVRRIKQSYESYNVLFSTRKIIVFLNIKCWITIYVILDPGEVGSSIASQKQRATGLESLRKPLVNPLLIQHHLGLRQLHSPEPGVWESTDVPR